MIPRSQGPLMSPTMTSPIALIAGITGGIGSDLARAFVTRDSSQVAERIDDPTCANSCAIS